MAIIRFKKEDVLKLLDMHPIGDIALVGDENGIYLMPRLARVNEKIKVYALGCNPTTDKHYRIHKNSLYGTKDGWDNLGSVKALKEWVSRSKKYCCIHMTSTAFHLTLDNEKCN